ncbi:MAG: hypothetical protein IJP66_04055, partial [Kiritimatiellae bacterium]|nr:hypothetical protein [Kiritimatiellia bacterium]
MLKPPDKLESDRGVAPAAAGVLLALALAFALALSAANIVLGPLNLDEGWYLLAARNFAAGLRPYRDFFFTQAPLMPAAYGALSPLWLPQGVLGGRVLTATLGLAASGLAACAAAVAAGQGRRFAAAVTAFLLLQCNVVHSYFTAIPKTYALAALFASGGALALALAMCRRKAAGTSSLLAGLLFALASATRLSLGAMLPAIGFCLLATHRRNGLLWFWFGIGGAAGLAIAIAPFALCDLDSFAFANFFHGGRSQGGVALALGSVSRLLRNYMPLALLALAAVSMAFSGMRRGAAAECGARAYLIALSLAFASAFAVHVLAPFPYDDYQTPIMPLAAIVASAAFWSLCGEARQAPLLAAFLLSSAAFALTSPMNESWLVLRKDRFWVERKTRPDLLALRDAARDVALISPPGAPI